MDDDLDFTLRELGAEPGHSITATGSVRTGWGDVEWTSARGAQPGAKWQVWWTASRINVERDDSDDGAQASIPLAYRNDIAVVIAAENVEQLLTFLDAAIAEALRDEPGC